jgi:hypothetical protein
MDKGNARDRELRRDVSSSVSRTETWWLKKALELGEVTAGEFLLGNRNWETRHGRSASKKRNAGRNN